jgi:hypothetical protein
VEVPGVTAEGGRVVAPVGQNDPSDRMVPAGLGDRITGNAPRGIARMLTMDPLEAPAVPRGTGRPVRIVTVRAIKGHVARVSGAMKAVVLKRLPRLRFQLPRFRRLPGLCPNLR